MKTFFLYLFTGYCATGFAKWHPQTGQQIFISYGGSCFNKFVSTPVMELNCSQTNYGIAAGYQINTWLDKRSELVLDLGISYYKSTYNYNDTMQPYTGAEKYKGQVTYANIFMTPEYSFKVVKWLQLNVGISLNFLLNNNFRNEDVARRIHWDNDEGQSTMKKFYSSYSIGAQINITKNLSLKFSDQTSFRPVAHTQVTYRNSVYKYRHWQRTELLSLYYKL